jgi:hypothetical protein
LTSSCEVLLGEPCNGLGGLNDNGGNRLDLGEGIIGLGDCLGLPDRVAFDFFRPNDSRFRRGLSSSEGRLNNGG